ncbi:CapA family protein [Puerhibacterium sp. TATVAM-FAB25]|uniref:CapA family protein n=1 Tax=Puerhibacterium sp. TATVAM-FAB25 TaxID=3093699 RepID=UPI00397AF9B9
MSSPEGGWRRRRAVARRRRRTVAAVAVLAVAAGLGVAAGAGLGRWRAETAEPPTPVTVPAAVAAQRQVPPAPAPAQVLTLLAAGDVLLHGPVNDSATTAAGTDYSPLLAGTDAWVGGADLALCHLEVPLAPPGEAPSGYPVFGAPGEIVRDLAEQGWDGCSTASNHTLDRGLAGVVATLDAFDAAGLGHAGTARDAAEAAAVQRYDLQRGGRTVRVAHLSATEQLNGFTPPADAPWAVQQLDVDALVAAARDARADGADVVVVSVHAGTEYTAEPTAAQRRVATALAESGQVDLVIGHHAHVPQPVERLPGGPGGTGMWVAYGLGNHLSNQDDACCAAATSDGVLLVADLRWQGAQAPQVAAVGWAATTVDREAGHRLRVLSGGDGSAAGTLGPDELRVRHDRVRTAVGPAAPERTAPPAPSGPGPVVVPRS